MGFSDGERAKRFIYVMYSSLERSTQLRAGASLALIRESESLKEAFAAKVSMVKKELSRIQETKTTTPKEADYRLALAEYFEKGSDATIEKLQNFTKYVPRQSLTRFLSKYELFKKVLNVQGSIVECGVYLGGGLMTFAQLSAILEPVNHQRRIIGFDTFTGFAAVSPQDKKSTSEHLKAGGLAADSYADLQRCAELYDQNRFLSHIPKVQLVKGDLSKTAPQFLKDNPHTVVSLLYLDLDVYEPTKIALQTFVPRMPKGSIIVFDELNADTWPGETLAVLETLGIKNLRIERFPFDTYLSYAVLE